jgi:hypothetical protein
MEITTPARAGVASPRASCAAADLSAWVRHAASILNVKPTRPVIASMMADLQIRVWVRNDQRIAP